MGKIKKLYVGKINKVFLSVNILVALIYFSWWLTFGNIGNPVMYFSLFFGEIYHIAMALMFWFTIWPKDENFFLDKSFSTNNFFPSVDIFIPVAGEPRDIVFATIQAAKNLDYPNFKVYILNDGYVAKKDNWFETENIAQSLGVNCITRTKPGGAKAGNINNGLRVTSGELVVIFDADMVASSNFLKKTVPLFTDSQVGFVQTPQFYKNFRENDVAGSAWEQQEFFFGPIMKGKEGHNASFICGTNVVIRRKALEEVGGMDEDNIAEDFLTSLRIHQRGWRSYYLTEVLAQGLAPHNLLSYFNQQLRWARGSMEVLFGFNPIFKKGLTKAQKIEYLSSAMYYFNGFVVAIDIVMPVLFLLFGLEPVEGSTTSFALYFIPFMLLNLFTLYLASGNRLTFRAIAFSQSSWTLQLLALKAVLLREKTSFSITPKSNQNGNFIFLALPHLIYTALALAAIGVGILREGLTPAVMTNMAWSIFNIAMFFPFIVASYNWRGIFAIRKASKALGSEIPRILFDRA